LIIQDSKRPLGRCLEEIGPPGRVHNYSGVHFLKTHIWRLAPGLPCIFATGHPHFERTLLRFGIRNFILVRIVSKPFHFTSLLVVVQEVLLRGDSRGMRRDT